MVTHPPRKTRFRLLVRLYRTGLVTRRVPSERFQACNYPPFPSFLARCRFIFSGENDELTPDFRRTPDFRPGENDELTPDFAPDFRTRRAEQSGHPGCRDPLDRPSIHPGEIRLRGSALFFACHCEEWKRCVALKIAANCGHLCIRGPVDHSSNSIKGVQVCPFTEPIE